MVIQENKFILSSGREINAYKNVIGINPELEEIFDGYDSRLDLKEYDYDTDTETMNFTPEEIAEICDYMLGLWATMKEKYGKSGY